MYEAKQSLLMLLDPRGRLQALNKILAQEVDVLELEDEIHSRVQSEVDKSQREFYLREQMRQIQNELGEGDVFTRDANELKKKVEAANLPEEPHWWPSRSWTDSTRCRRWRLKWASSAPTSTGSSSFRGQISHPITWM